MVAKIYFDLGNNVNRLHLHSSPGRGYVRLTHTLSLKASGVSWPAQEQRSISPSLRRGLLYIPYSQNFDSLENYGL